MAILSIFIYRFSATFYSILSMTDNQSTLKIRSHILCFFFFFSKHIFERMRTNQQQQQKNYIKKCAASLLCTNCIAGRDFPYFWTVYFFCFIKKNWFILYFLFLLRRRQCVLRFFVYHTQTHTLAHNNVKCQSGKTTCVRVKYDILIVKITTTG